MYTKFMMDEEGQGLVEYALIILLVAIAVVGLLTALGGDIGNTFSSISSTLSGAGGS
jgi:pilus assembly protein Flp/PilA